MANALSTIRPISFRTNVKSGKLQQRSAAGRLGYGSRFRSGIQPFDRPLARTDYSAPDRGPSPVAPSAPAPDPNLGGEGPDVATGTSPVDRARNVAEMMFGADFAAGLASPSAADYGKGFLSDLYGAQHTGAKAKMGTNVLARLLASSRPSLAMKLAFAPVLPASLIAGTAKAAVAAQQRGLQSVYDQVAARRSPEELRAYERMMGPELDKLGVTTRGPGPEETGFQLGERDPYGHFDLAHPSLERSTLAPGSITQQQSEEDIAAAAQAGRRDPNAPDLDLSFDPTRGPTDSYGLNALADLDVAPPPTVQDYAAKSREAVEATRAPHGIQQFDPISRETGPGITPGLGTPDPSDPFGGAWSGGFYGRHPAGERGGARETASNAGRTSEGYDTGYGGGGGIGDFGGGQESGGFEGGDFGGGLGTGGDADAEGFW